MATKTQTIEERYEKALERITPMRRHHAGPDMDEAYAALLEYYPKSELIGYPTGDRCGAWEAPKGWVVNEAKLAGPDGRIIADYYDHPLSLFTYSPPFSGEVTREELEAHLFSDPSRPDAIPFHFRNQYLQSAAQWGFCLRHRDREALPEGRYKVEIDTAFPDSEMQMVLQTHHGDSQDSLLLVGHFDHPAQAGDGLAGCLAGHEAISRLAGRRTRLTYRMLSTVEIVGSVFYAARRAHQDGVREGLFSAMAGVDAPLVYARSAHETSAVDSAMAHVLRHSDEVFTSVGFRSAAGNDEIAFDVHGVDIPCSSLMRWPHPHYHTDQDTAQSMDGGKMESFITILLRVIDILENNTVLTGRFDGLPRLSHPDIDLYVSPTNISGVRQENDSTAACLMARLPDDAARREALRAVENFNAMMTLIPPLADGEHTTIDIAERAGVPFVLVDAYTDMWQEKGLLEKVWINPFTSKEEPR